MLRYKRFILLYYVVVNKIYYINLMVSYFYSFNPFIGIIKTGKYLSDNIR